MILNIWIFDIQHLILNLRPVIQRWKIFEQVIQDGKFTCMKFEYKSPKNDKMKNTFTCLINRDITYIMKTCFTSGLLCLMLISICGKNAGAVERSFKQTGIKITGRNINKSQICEEQHLMAESAEEPKHFFMWAEESK